MDFITPELVAVNVYNVCMSLQADPTQIPVWQDVATLIGTASVESAFVLGGKRKRKAATFGIFGIGIKQSKVLYQTLRHPESFMKWREATKKWRHSKTAWTMFSTGWLGITSLPYVELTDRELRYLMAHDLRFACSMCRWAYLNLMEQAPETLSEIADLWESKYNFDDERTATTFLDAWHKNECSKLMAVVGYE